MSFVRWPGLTLLLLALLTIHPRLAGAQAEPALAAEAARLHAAAQFREAVDAGARALAATEQRHGPDHPETARAFDALARSQVALALFAEAEGNLKRALAIRMAASGPRPTDIAASHHELAELYRLSGWRIEAEQFGARALELRIAALGTAHPDVAATLDTLADLARLAHRLAEAEQMARRSLAIREAALGASHADVAASLTTLAVIHENQLQRQASEAAFKRALAIREAQLPANHPDIAAALNGYAALLAQLARYGEAEQHLTRARSIRETTLGATHPALAATLVTWSVVRESQGRFEDAEKLLAQSLAIREAAYGGDNAETAVSLNNLGNLHRVRGRFREAEPMLQRALAIREAVLGAEHPAFAATLNNLAELYRAQGKYRESEPLFERALALREKAHGASHPAVATTLNSLATQYEAEGRFADAEPLYKRALAIREATLGPSHPEVGAALNNLALNFRYRGRFADAEPLMRRAIAVREEALGPNHPAVAISLSNLADIYRQQRRNAEAEPLYLRANAALEASLGPSHSLVASGLNNLASFYEAQGRLAEAEPLFKRALAIQEAALGASHPMVGTAQHNLASLYRLQGRLDEAEPLYRRALAISEAALAPDHPSVTTGLTHLGYLALARERWEEARSYFERSTAQLIRRSRRGSASLGQPLTGRVRTDAARSGHTFDALVKAAYRVAGSEPQRAQWAAQARAAFLAAQWRFGSESADALAQMAARGAKGDGALAPRVRERQDLVEEWQHRDRQRSAAQSQPPAVRDRDAEAANASRLEEIDKRLAELDARLAAEFPDYAALARPEPLSIEEVQAELAPDEAFVLVLDTGEMKPVPEETFVWVITKSDARWLRSELGRPMLAREVAALRCGLDFTAWTGAGAQRCAQGLGLPAGLVPRADEQLPYDVDRAHRIYRALLGEAGDLIAGRHLLVVAPGALAQLPLQALVTAPFSGGDLRAVGWLARQNALTVLPAVSSLKALRRHARPSAAQLPMIGFGNPLLDGMDARMAGAAKLARELQHCTQALRQREAATQSERRLRALRTGLADSRQLKTQSPLPETAYELCTVARQLRADLGEIRLGMRASEREIKALSGSGRLAQYRVVHFATHGTLAGEIAGSSEPGLILTPPVAASGDDDGYLSASEIAGLKLDADWVILSACNTAAGGATGAEALSGLARAFFFAQARALLVSHWNVYSDTTVKLVTHTMGTLAREPALGRAEALRRAMVAMIDTGEPREAHPAYWAPFVVVGEGAGETASSATARRAR